MSDTRKALIAAVAVLALGGSMVASAAPADAHTYKKVGTASAKEANKLFKEAFKQKCLTIREAQHLAHGKGEQWSNWESEEDVIRTTLSFNGTKKSKIEWIQVSFLDKPGDHSGASCAIEVDAYKLAAGEQRLES